ncbi:DNA topoisomerase 6 subunit A-like [Lotus japonicus]|uniref:DNA topoisomerase 6 subunit A-like n=1 Tax=Lotus japonicus TaxID=34305 RepID=UPI00258276AE|nr:DNA topoisomerase 6 subunit A-like [Lotus japonicus]
MTKREVFYLDPVTFQNQDASDAVIDDIACMVCCTRVSLNIVAAQRGTVIRSLTFSDREKTIDCMRIEGGTHILPRVHELEFIRSEKHAIFCRLIQNKFNTRLRCIIVTFMGYPDVSTRLFVRRMHMDLELHVFALMDADPFVIDVLSVYRYGSKNMSYDNRNLVIPGYNNYHQLVKKEFVKENPEWVGDLNYMLANEKKCETQAFNSHGLGYLCNFYLPAKLQEILEPHLCL